jgi:hypothetical protein
MTHAQGPFPDPWRPINVYVTRDVAFNAEKMHKVTAQVLERIGCGGCHSGRILFFRQLENFVVNPQTLALQEIAGGGLGI